MKQTVLIAILTAVVTFLAVKSCQKPVDPGENPQVRHHVDTIKHLKGRVATLQGQIKAILEKRGVDSTRSERRQRAANAKIMYLTNKANEFSLKLAAQLDSLPEIDSLLTLKQSIIDTQASEIDSLTADLITERESFHEFRQMTQTEDRIQNRMIAEFEQMTGVLQADNAEMRKRLAKRPFLRGMLVGVLTTVGIYVAVNQLVE